jgi:hypothetical protein
MKAPLTGHQRILLARDLRAVGSQIVNGNRADLAEALEALGMIQTELRTVHKNERIIAARKLAGQTEESYGRELRTVIEDLNALATLRPERHSIRQAERLAQNLFGGFAFDRLSFRSPDADENPETARRRAFEAIQEDSGTIGQILSSLAGEEDGNCQRDPALVAGIVDSARNALARARGLAFAVMEAGD